MDEFKNKKRLLKDLPFSDLTVGTVIWKGGRGHGGEFSVSNGKTYYKCGGSSDNGIRVFEQNEEDILDTIWEDKKWFEEANIKHIDILPKTNSIILRFDSIDLEDAEDLAKGIINILPHLKDDSYTWNKFSDITTQIVNN